MDRSIPSFPQSPLFGKFDGAGDSGSTGRGQSQRWGVRYGFPETHPELTPNGDMAR
jgi:hypothetical protein